MTDLMASVAVTFLLIASIFIVKSAEATKKELKPVDLLREEQEKSRDSLRRLLQALQGSAEISSVANVVEDPNDRFLLTITYRSEQLTFDTDRADLNPGARKVVEQSFPVLISEICAVIGRVETVFLEGHTDAQGGMAKFQRNVELSSQRAHSVFFAGRATVAHEDRLRRCIDSNFTVAGRGPVQPADSTLAAHWADSARKPNAKDRRVEIKVRFSAGEKKLLELEPRRASDRADLDVTAGGARGRP
jgi:flagellar motor protein MotB